MTSQSASHVLVSRFLSQKQFYGTKKFRLSICEVVEGELLSNHKLIGFFCSFKGEFRLRDRRQRRQNLLHTIFSIYNDCSLFRRISHGHHSFFGPLYSSSCSTTGISLTIVFVAFASFQSFARRLEAGFWQWCRWELFKSRSVQCLISDPRFSSTDRSSFAHHSPFI